MKFEEGKVWGVANILKKGYSIATLRKCLAKGRREERGKGRENSEGREEKQTSQRPLMK